VEPISPKIIFSLARGTFNYDDVSWLSPSGSEMSAEQWQDGNTRCFGMLLDGRAQESVKRRGSDATLLLVYNAHFDVVNFALPAVPDGTNWMGLIDTNQPEAELPAFSFGEDYAVTGRSLLVFGLAAGDSMTRRLRHGMGSILDAIERPL
jgi:isoamylase